MSTRCKSLTVDTLNANLRKAKYEVRGEIYLAAVKRTEEGKEVIYTNVGNPQALGQKPLTFNRQVMALMMAPFIMDDPNCESMFAPDAIARAKLYLQHVKGGLGAYSDSRGNPYIRQEVANYISRTCGGPSSPNHVFFGNGASEVARMVLNATIRGPTDGIMVPIPQYPLYSASIQLYGGELVGYYLDEENGWGMNVAELQRSLDSARERGILVRAFVFINPGNPTGQCLSAENVKELLRFCYDNR